MPRLENSAPYNPFSIMPISWVRLKVLRLYPYKFQDVVHIHRTILKSSRRVVWMNYSPDARWARYGGGATFRGTRIQDPRNKNSRQRSQGKHNIIHFAYWNVLSWTYYPVLLFPYSSIPLFDTWLVVNPTTVDWQDIDKPKFRMYK